MSVTPLDPGTDRGRRVARDLTVLLDDIELQIARRTAA